MEMGAPLVRLGWRPPGLFVPLPPLSSPARQKSRRIFLLVPAYLGSPGPKAVKRSCVCVCVCVCTYFTLFDLLFALLFAASTIVGTEPKC